MTIIQRIGELKERIEKACIRSGRKPEEVRLMGVSKFHEPGEIEEALAGGITLFGENRVQEALRKFAPLKERYGDIELHLIGSLQRNKAKSALTVCDAIQSLDRNELITTLGSLTVNRDRALTVLLELHTGEESKSGYPDEDSLYGAAELVLSYRGLKLSGLMTMAPYTQDQTCIRRSFRTLVHAWDGVQKRFPEAELSYLSMGMTNDFETAVEEGSTLVRIGTAIFGERQR
jgi:pyridoxal phosphate enzyme (YggS family)